MSVVSLVSVDSYLDWLDLNCKLCFWPAPFLPLAELLSICHIYMHGPLMVETWADRIWGYLLCLVPFKDFSILFSGHVSSDFSFLFPQARKPVVLHSTAPCVLYFAQGWKLWRWEPSLYNSPSSSMCFPLESVCFFYSPVLSHKISFCIIPDFTFFYEGESDSRILLCHYWKQKCILSFKIYSIFLFIIFMFFFMLLNIVIIADLKSLPVSPSLSFLGYFFWLIFLLFKLI